MKNLKLLLVLVFLLSLNNSFAIERPFPNTSKKDVISNCHDWAIDSLNNNRNTFVMAFEGLATYKKKAAKKLYRYNDQLLLGENPAEPANKAFAFVTENIIKKNLRALYKKSDFLVMPHGGEGKKNSNSLLCTLEFIKVHQNNLNLIIVGHSFGGPAAKRLMNSLEKIVPNFEIRNMLSLDPRLKSKFVTKPNVQKHHVYYQKGAFRGYPYSDPRGGSYTINTHIPGRDISGPENNNHANLTLHELVQNTYMSFF